MVIPKPHDLGFCFIAPAPILKEFDGLTVAPQTIPASPAVLMYRNLKVDFCLVCVTQGCSPLPLALFPVYRFCCAASCWLDFARIGYLIHRRGWVNNHFNYTGKLVKPS